MILTSLAVKLAALDKWVVTLTLREVIAAMLLRTCFSQKENVMNPKEEGKKMGRLIAKCWVDESYKHKLMADPVAMLKMEGLSLPVDIRVNVFENNNKVFSLLLPRQLLS